MIGGKPARWNQVKCGPVAMALNLLKPDVEFRYCLKLNDAGIEAQLKCLDTKLGIEQ
jgi:hypothetical protein